MSVAGYKTSLLVSLSKNGKVRVWDTTTASSSLHATCCVGTTSVTDAPVGLKCHESLLYIACSSSLVAIDLRTMRRVFTIAQQAKIHLFEAIPSKSIYFAPVELEEEFFGIRGEFLIHINLSQTLNWTDMLAL